MKQFKSLLAAQLLVVATLLLPWSPAGALEEFRLVGVISSVGHDKFTVRDKEYRIAPDAQLRSSDPGRKKLSDFRKGDRIYFEGKILNGIHYVDMIVYETPVPS